MTSSDPLPDVEPGQGPTTPLVIATLHRPEGVTGVQTHVSELLAHLERHGRAATLVTPFSWGGPLTVPVFGPRLVLSRVSSAAGVMWHRHWHEAFLRQALRRQLGRLDDCVIYAQGPAAARAALRARRGPQQVVVMAIHFRVSQADEYVESGQIARDGRVFRRLRQVERAVIPQLDGVVAVTRWARDALLAWLPEADTVPYAVISNFVHRQPAAVAAPLADLVTIGRLEPVKNHGFLLEVLAEANRRGRRHTLDVYGEGDSRVSLEQQAKTLGVEQQVRFRGFRSDVRTLLPRYRAYIHAAYSESSSLAIMESMAAGLPILAGDLAPLRELCDDGVEARFFPLADPARAAVAMIETLDREPMRAEMSRAARDRFDRNFEAEVLAPELLSFLESRVPSISRSRS